MTDGIRDEAGRGTNQVAADTFTGEDVAPIVAGKDRLLVAEPLQPDKIRDELISP